MRVVALATAEAARMTRRIAGVEPWASPPGSAETYEPGLLEGYDLVVVALHGGPGWSYLAGDDGLVALTAAQVLTTDLSGSVVFGVTCNLGDPESPMREAFLAAGAAWVVGGAGRNWGGRNLGIGSGLLGLWFRRLVALGLSVPRALAGAKARTALSGLWYPGPVRDALAFGAWSRSEV